MNTHIHCSRKYTTTICSYIIRLKQNGFQSGKKKKKKEAKNVKNLLNWGRLNAYLHAQYSVFAQ